MKDLKAVSALVKHFLRQSEAARNSDNELYLLVVNHYCEKMGISLCDMTVLDFFRLVEHRRFPSFETVRRSRQKVQQTYPELAATGEVAMHRNKKQNVYRAFANGTV